MKKGVLIVVYVLFLSKTYAQSPGGVSTNIRWWLKANAGTFTDAGVTPATDNAAVQQWNDMSGINNHANQLTPTNQPIYRTNIINGNPVLRFNNNQFVDATTVAGVGPNDNLHMFLVFKQNSYTAGGTGDGSGTYIIDRTSGTNNLMSFKMASTNKYFYQKRNDGGGSLTGPLSVTAATNGPFLITSYYRNFNVDYGIILNGKIDATSGGDNEPITGPQLRVGRHATIAGGGINGDIAEVILYNTAISVTDRQKIESYLAIKYGISIDQTVPTNYLTSNGDLIYPAANTSHDAYDQNIAGIGRDDGSGLLQTASQNQNANSIVRISSPSNLDNDEFLMWGNDAPTIWNSTDVPAGYVNRISRIWRVSKRGDVGTFSISFDLTGLGIDLSDPTKFALLVDGDGIFGNAAAHTTGRSIVGNVVSFTGASINTNQYFSLASNLIPGPGGVAATTVWLRADEGVYNDAGTTLATSGQTVRQWNTTGGISAANPGQANAANRPTYQTNISNSNPVVRFNTSTYLDFGILGVSNTSDLSFTMVFRPNVTAGGTISDNAGRYMMDRTISTTPQLSLKLLSTGKIGFQTRADAGAINGPSTTTNVSSTTMQIVDFYRDYGVRFGIFYNGAQEGTLAESLGTLTFPIPRLGATWPGGGGLDGDMSEFIFYTRDITSAERNRIDTYLAIKYGISLDQVTLTNYTAADGTVVYPAATGTHSDYIFDIAGIARDNVSRLVQSNSKSANANSVVRMQNPSSLGDTDYLLWGDDGGSLTSGSTAVDGTTIQRRLARVWRVAERNDVGTVDISFDLTQVPGSKSQADLRLLIDRDWDGFADNDVAPRTGTLVGQIFTVTGVDLVDKDFFTIGSTNVATTPLPIQLTNFEVAVHKDGVLVDWTTMNEVNNDYFSIERSIDGEDFDEVMRIPGAGTSDGAHNYEVIDNPYALGDIYYRLKQTDFDGKTTRSAIKKVTLTESAFFVKVYPNPVDNNEVTVELPVSNYAASIQLMNSAGQVVYSGMSSDSSNVLNVSALPKGIYFLRVMSNTGASSSKLVIR